MTFKKLLIANRGEIAIRIARSAADVGIKTVAIFSSDDAQSLHARRADEAVEITGRGARAYLDIAAIVAVATAAGCDAVHPGYGFLSENADFARACAYANLAFVGPNVEALELFGDKAQAKALARRAGVPIIEGSDGATTLATAQDFFTSLGPSASMMIKAIAGGGGRGMRVVEDASQIADAFERCRSEALAAFGNGDLYVERLVRSARHIEVQIVADRHGTVVHLGERECTLQRRHQKLVEIAPSPSLSQTQRSRLTDASVVLAQAARYDAIGTFEFLLDADRPDDPDGIAFIEANPRIQVEHTVTEEVFGVDLVATQLRIASGETIAAIGLADRRIANGFAVQARVNMETMDASGATTPTGGTLSAFEPPTGPGVRVDTFGYAGYRTSAAFDSLLAKVVLRAPDFLSACHKADRALREFRIDGVATNIDFLRALLVDDAVRANRVTTRFLDVHAAGLVARASVIAHERLASSPSDQATTEPTARFDAPAGTVAIPTPLQGTVVIIDVGVGDIVRAGQQIGVLEAMKMEHLVVAPEGGIVRAIRAAPGATLMHGEPMLFLEPSDVGENVEHLEETVDPDAIRADHAHVIERHEITLDRNRPAAVARRRKTNQRTTRENLAQLFDADSFIEYGALAIAGQRRRRALDDLIANTPADGLVTGIGTVNAEHFGDDARCMALAYDYTVLAGTQGHMNHKKIDRMLSLAEQWQMPIVLYAEGGGGRPGDTDRLGLTGLDGPSFVQMAKLSGLVPMVGVVSGYCFAGNAALLGCCDVIIATKNASIGMGGPAMIEGGGLGVYHPADVGPASFQSPNGVIDVLVDDEEEATSVARKYLSYFQGPVKDWRAADQRSLRRAIPENRLRVYDIRAVIDMLADDGSVLDLRRAFGVGMVTALIRIEGQPFGLIANNSKHLGGAIDAEAGDKAARFMQLCDAFDLPILSLCDTPGFMVGPEAEKTAIVRHVARMFVVGASLTVPIFTIVLRKGYGLGAQAMAGGGFHAPFFTVAWPTGEFGGMGLEGYVRLGFRKEMEAIKDAAEREAWYKAKVAQMYENGKATSIASVFEIDDVIDPAETRRWIMGGLRSVPKPVRNGRKRPCIDAW